MIDKRIRRALFAIGLLLCSSPVGAQTVPKPTDDMLWSESIPSAVEADKLAKDVDRGQDLYEVCSECHLASGAGNPDGTMPQLAGQHRRVLIKQLMDIRSGLRQNPAMYPFVARLDGSQDLADLAAYIETLPIPIDNGQGPGHDLERGRQLYDAQCSRCHGLQGEGDANAFYPRLAAQHYRYLVRQIIDIAGGRRGNANPDMANTVENFTARDVADVADYISRMHISRDVDASKTRR